MHQLTERHTRQGVRTLPIGLEMVDESLATVTLDRPERHNALDRAMWLALAETLEALSADDELRAVIVRGAGEEAFSAGADIQSFPTERATRALEDDYAVIFHRSMQAVRTCRHPVIAAIEGICMGGGAGIATMCDMRVAAQGTRFGITARNLGLFYPHAEMDAVLQIAGYATAFEVFVEGRIYDADEALAKGLVGRVVPKGQAYEAALALARHIAAGSPLAARFHKKALQTLRGPLPVPQEDHDFVNSFVETEDFQAAYRAFLEKRRPSFHGR